ncbi:MAG: hypothetical protein ABIG67_09210 [Pseudomonadota bacterium]
MPYMMIGSWALAVRGRPKATMDLDFMAMVDEGGLGYPLPFDLYR